MDFIAIFLDIQKKIMGRLFQTGQISGGNSGDSLSFSPPFLLLVPSPLDLPLPRQYARLWLHCLVLASPTRPGKTGQTGDAPSKTNQRRNYPLQNEDISKKRRGKQG